MFPDSFTYLAMSRAMFDGSGAPPFREGVATYLPPLYPLAIALLSPVVGTIERTAVVVSALAGAATILPVWWLTRKLFGSTAAWIAIVLSATNPLLVHWSTHALTESVFILLAVSSVAVIYCAMETGSTRWWVVGGLLCGLSYLTRITGLALFGALLGFLVIVQYLMRQTPRDIVVRMVLLGLGFALVAVPYISFLRAQLGYWSIGGSYGSVSQYLRHAGSTDPIVWEESFGTAAPPDIEAKLTQNVVDYTRAFVATNSASLLFALALYLPWKKWPHPPRSGHFLLGVAVAAMVGTPILIGSVPYLVERVRYVSPTIPLVLILASGGVAHIATMAARARGVFIALSVATIIGAAVFHLLSVPGVAFYPAWKPAEPSRQKLVGEWMKTHLPSPLVVMARRPAVPYFADAVWYITPLTIADLFSMAQQSAIGYVVVDRRVDGPLHSEVGALLDTSRPPAGLDLMASYRLSDGRMSIAVYKISGPESPIPLGPLSHD